MDKIVRHVVEAEAAYLGRLGSSFRLDEHPELESEQRRMRAAVLAGLALAARGEIPARGPRGGLRWTPSYFVRRVAWHILNHAWEIEDRSHEPLTAPSSQGGHPVSAPGQPRPPRGVSRLMCTPERPHRVRHAHDAHLRAGGLQSARGLLRHAGHALRRRSLCGGAGIRLTEDRYCSVYVTLKAAVEILSRYEILTEEPIANSAG
ncbi:MAG: hypothetical protein NTY23_15325 [Chloroflexi bacterium]|nr:hypothetical protein [Chloroflexota bacterium]